MAVIDLKSRQRRRLEHDALVYHYQHQAEPFRLPPEQYVEALRFRLRRRLGIDVDKLCTRGQWVTAADDLFRLEMADVLRHEDTPPVVRDMFPEFGERWRD